MPLQGTPLVQYYFDEAASGTTPTQADDSSGNAFHLDDISYGSSTMNWAETSGNRGLESTDKTGNHYARTGVDNTTDIIRDNIDSSTAYTLEIVVDVQDGYSNTGRIFTISDRAGSSPEWGLTNVVNATSSHTGFRWYHNKIGYTNFTIGSATPTGRKIIHVVWDSSLGAGSRVTIYEDGTDISYGGSEWTATTSISNDVDLILLNRESTGSYARSIDGIVYYAAIYSSALSGAQVSNNATVLADDDSPAASGTIIEIPTGPLR